MPVALAVVPVWLNQGGLARIAASRESVVIQHGYSHDNHAPTSAKSMPVA